MYIIGYINLNDERALINPRMCRSIEDLYEAITELLDSKDYKIDPPITKEGLVLSLQAGEPVRINFGGYNVALLFGKDDIIENNTDRYVHLID